MVSLCSFLILVLVIAPCHPNSPASTLGNVKAARESECQVQVVILPRSLVLVILPGRSDSLICTIYVCTLLIYLVAMLQQLRPDNLPILTTSHPSGIVPSLNATVPMMEYGGTGDVIWTPKMDAAPVQLSEKRLINRQSEHTHMKQMYKQTTGSELDHEENATRKRLRFLQNCPSRLKKFPAAPTINEMIEIIGKPLAESISIVPGLQEAQSGRPIFK